MENQAQGEVARIYRQIRESLGLNSVPHLFTYFGGFPDYLDYISRPVVANFADKAFQEKCHSLFESVEKGIVENLSVSGRMTETAGQLRTNPEFVKIEADLKKVFQANLKVAVIFITLRESLKSWVKVTARLPNGDRKDQAEEERKVLVSGFDREIVGEIFGGQGLANQEKGLTIAEGQKGLTIDWFAKYLQLAQQDLFLLMKTNQYWQLRVDLEEVFWKLWVTYLTRFYRQSTWPINLLPNTQIFRS